MTDLELDPALLEMLRTLAAHDVEFVLVGDVAAAIHDQGGFVAGLKIVPGGYGRNAERLNAALQAMDAERGIAGADGQRDYRAWDLRHLAPCSFQTRHADIEIDFEPAGSSGYRDLFDDAARVELTAGVRPLVASSADLERMRGGTNNEPRAQPRQALPAAAEALWADQIRAGRATRI